MHSLIIDTSTERGLLSIFQDGSLLYRADLPFGLQNSQYLLSELFKAFDSTNVNIRTLGFIAVGVGPGSYTGIRVGAVAAKTLSFACRIPLIGICTLDAFVPDREGKYAALIDARIGGVYLQTGMKEKEEISCLKGPWACSLEHAVKELRDISVLVTPAAGQLCRKFAALVPDNSWNWLELPPSPAAMYVKALEKFRSGEFSCEGKLELLYMRKTQAEMEKDRNSLFRGFPRTA
jgi:tRNA threonylcarbamoyladenosine biosynthesis protein TsaB